MKYRRFKPFGALLLLVVGLLILYINVCAETSTPIINNVIYVSRQGMIDGHIENSLDGIRAAKKTGFKVIRIDVQFTSDGIPVLFHDAYLGKQLLVYNNKGETITGGKISEYTYAELIGYSFGKMGNRIATLEDAITVC